MSDDPRPRDLPHLTIADLTAVLRGAATVDPRLLRALARDPRKGVRALAAQVRSRETEARRETFRLDGLFAVEREQRAVGFTSIAGVDEAGVAPLAGPVVAAAVILPPDAHLPYLNDSKCLSQAQREALYDQIMRTGVATHVGAATVEEIDRINILQATRLAHRRAVLGLSVRPHLILIDGRYPADVAVPQLVIVDGDATCASIAAASVVAKVTRDRIMADLARQYPDYGFAQHKGYPTRAHLEAIRRCGISPAHRQSFFPVRSQQERLV